jgi:hypothetical protein
MAGDQSLDNKTKAENLAKQAVEQNNLALIDASKVTLTDAHDFSFLGPAQLELLTKDGTILTRELATGKKAAQMLRFNSDNQTSLAILRADIVALGKEDYNEQISLNNIINNDRGAIRVFKHADEKNLKALISPYEEGNGAAKIINLSAVEKRLAGLNKDFQPLKEGQTSLKEHLGIKEDDTLTYFKFNVKDPDHVRILTNMVSVAILRDAITDKGLQNNNAALASPIEKMRDNAPSNIDISRDGIKAGKDNYIKTLGNWIKAETPYKDYSWYDPRGFDVLLPSGDGTLKPENLETDFPRASQDYIRNLNEKIGELAEDMKLERHAIDITDKNGQTVAFTLKKMLAILDNQPELEAPKTHDYWTKDQQATYNSIIDLAKTDTPDKTFAEMRTSAMKLSNRNRNTLYDERPTKRQEELDRIEKLENDFYKLVDKLEDAIIANNDIVPLDYMNSADIFPDIIKYAREQTTCLNGIADSDLHMTHPAMIAAIRTMAPKEHGEAFKKATGETYGLEQVHTIYNRTLSLELDEAAGDIRAKDSIKELKTFINHQMVGNVKGIDKPIETDETLSSPEFIKALRLTRIQLQKDRLENGGKVKPGSNVEKFHNTYNNLPQKQKSMTINAMNSFGLTQNLNGLIDKKIIDAPPLTPKKDLLEPFGIETADTLNKATTALQKHIVDQRDFFASNVSIHPMDHSALVMREALLMENNEAIIEALTTPPEDIAGDVATFRETIALRCASALAIQNENATQPLSDEEITQEVAGFLQLDTLSLANHAFEQGLLKPEEIKQFNEKITVPLVNHNAKIARKYNIVDENINLRVELPDRLNKITENGVIDDNLLSVAYALKGHIQNEHGVLDPGFYQGADNEDTLEKTGNEIIALFETCVYYDKLSPTQKDALKPKNIAKLKEEKAAANKTRRTADPDLTIPTDHTNVKEKKADQTAQTSQGTSNTTPQNTGTDPATTVTKDDNKPAVDAKPPKEKDARDLENPSFVQRVKEFQSVMGHKTIDGKLNDETKADLLQQMGILYTTQRGDKPFIAVGVDGKEFQVHKDGNILAVKDDGTTEQAGTFKDLDKAHPATLPTITPIMLSQRTKAMNECISTVNRAFDTRITDKLKIAAPNSTPQQRSFVVAALREAQSKNAAEKLLKNNPALGQNPDEVLEVLWTTEQSRKAFNNYPNLSSIAEDQESYADFHKFSATVDIYRYLSIGDMHSTLDPLRSTAAPALLAELNDSLFISEVYEQYYTTGQVDGALVGQPGVILDREAFAKLALERFENLAAKSGIAPQDITKAMADGSFNPAFQDLELMHKCLVPDETLELKDFSAEYKRDLIALGAMKPDELPDVSTLACGYALKRDEAWNKRFGSMKDIGTVNTIMAGKEVNADSMDFGVRLLQRQYTRDGFLKNYGVNSNVALSYDELKKTLSPTAAARLEGDVKTLLDRTCAYEYFSQITLAKGDAADFKADYIALRDNRYSPAYKKMIRSHAIVSAEQPDKDSTQDSIKEAFALNKEAMTGTQAAAVAVTQTQTLDTNLPKNT